MKIRRRLLWSVLVVTMIMSLFMPMFSFAAPNQIDGRNLPANDLGAKPHAARTGGLFNLYPSLEESRAGLNDILEHALAIDLSAYPQNLAAQVSHAISRAMSLCEYASANDVNIARLRLQVAVDALIVDLQRVNVSQLQELVRAGRLTYVELLRMYLSRIELYDFNTVQINSVLALNPNAFEIAAAKDAMVAADPSLATGIFGMTVLVKDNIGTIGTEGMATTAGSVALRYNFAPFDATIITAVRDAGGIILGKVNLSEFANWTASGTLAANAPARAWYYERFGVVYPHPGNAPSGHSSWGGQVLNPYNTDIAPQGWPVLTAIGSSTGSGSSAAAALSAVTIGTETSGSILSPSRATSTVGIKPTVGLLSRYGVLPLAASYDTAGPMTRNVHDAAALLTVMARYDANDITDPHHTAPDFTLDYTQFLNRNALQGRRLGVVGGAATMNNTPEGQRAREILEYLGATIVTGVTVSGGVQTSVLQFEFHRDLNNYLSRMTDPRLQVRTLLDIIDYHHHNPATVPAWGFHTLINSFLNAQTAEQNETVRLTSIMNARNSIDNALREHNLDALISFTGFIGAGAASGYPSVTVPIGYNLEVPIPANNRSWNPFFSLVFTGTAYSEASLIAMAYAFEQASMVRTPPGMAVRDDLRGLISRVDAMGESAIAPILDVLNEARAVASSIFSTQMCVDLAYESLKAAISTPITEAAISVTVPIAGNVPNTTAAGQGNFTIGSVMWTPNHNPFQVTTMYTATVALTANEGYTFSGIINITINGEAATVVGTPGSTITISREFVSLPRLTTTVFAEDWRETINIRFFLDGVLSELPLEDIVFIVDGVEVPDIRNYTVNIAGWQTSASAVFINKLANWRHIVVEASAYGQTVTLEFVNNMAPPIPVLTTTVYAEDWRETINIRFFLDGVLTPLPLEDIVFIVDGVEIADIRNYTVNIAGWQTSTSAVFINKLAHNWQHMIVHISAYGQTVTHEFINNMFVPPPTLTTTIFAEEWRESINIRFFLDGVLTELPLENIVLIADGVRVADIRDFTINVAGWQTSTNAIFISRTRTPWTTMTINITAYGQTLTYTFVNTM